MKGGKKVFKEKWKALQEKYFKKDADGDRDHKRKIENLVVFVILIIVTLIVINQIWNGQEEGKQSMQNEEVDDKVLASQEITENMVSSSSSTDLENSLETILGNIEGVGKVKVLITYSESSQTVPMFNEDTSISATEETDTNGGSRKISQENTKKEVIYQEVDGEKIPITQSVIMPTIEGAIITAAGAGNATVKSNIIQAVEAATGLATHKIQVFPMAT